MRKRSSSSEPVRDRSDATTTSDTSTTSDTTKGTSTSTGAVTAGAEQSERPARRPTLRDVADAAGVSFKTVSRVVNGEEGVSAALMHRVEAAIEELRYVPDERARHLRQVESRPNSIGFALVDVSNPFFSAILRGLEDVARERNCLVLSGSSDFDPARQDALIESFIARRVSGLVVVPCSDQLGPIATEVLRGTPVVFLDGEPKGHASDRVRTDHRQGARAMTEHLLAHGHREIGFLGDDPSIFSARLRLEGFRTAMADAGLAVDERWVVTGQHTPLEWRDEIHRWLTTEATLPTAILTAQNFVTMGAVRALHELGLENEIALVGFDDIELGDVVSPGISVLPQDPARLGRLAGEILFARLDGSSAPPVSEILPAQVIARGSGEIPPSRRPPARSAAGAGRGAARAADPPKARRRR